MLFLPYRIDMELARIPWATVLIVVICITVYLTQLQSTKQSYAAAQQYCTQHQDRMFSIVLQKATTPQTRGSCVETLLYLHSRPDAGSAIAKMVSDAAGFDSLKRADAENYMLHTLENQYRAFRGAAPDDLTARLAYDPHQFAPLRMITSVFAHCSWIHLAGNVIFFFTFAAAVELILGTVRYVAAVLCLALGVGAAYWLHGAGDPASLPTIGLSGVVMGMIGLLAYFLPLSRIRCFLWLMFIVRIWSVPAWILALWYLGWDIYALQSGGNGNVNVIAHISGVSLGLVMGMLFFRSHKRNLLHAKAAPYY